MTEITKGERKNEQERKFKDWVKVKQKARTMRRASKLTVDMTNEIRGKQEESVQGWENDHLGQCCRSIIRLEINFEHWN